MPDDNTFLGCQLAPDARHAAHRRLTAETALGPDLAGDARHLVRECAELLDERVDRVLQLEDLALDVDRDRLGQVALRDGGRHARDLADLRRQVRRHQVHGVGQILPDATDALDTRLRTELAFAADFLRDAGHLGAELREPGDHAVDDARVAQELAAPRTLRVLELHRLLEVAPRDGGHDARDLVRVAGEVVDDLVHRRDVLGP